MDLQKMGLYSEAIECFKKYMLEHPKDVFNHKQLAYTYSLLKNYDSSLQHANICIDLNPQDHYSYFVKGQALSSSGKANEAIEAFEKAISLKDNNCVYYNQLGLAYGETKNYDKAIECYEKAYQIAPKVIYLNNRADMEIKRGNYTKAIDILNEVLEKDPGYSIALQNMAECYEFLNRLEDALSSYTRAAAVDGNNAMIYYNRGTLLKKMEKIEEAKQDFKVALELALKKSFGNIFLTETRIEEIQKNLQQELAN